MFNSWLHFDQLAQKLAESITGAVCGMPFTYQKNHLHIPLENAGRWRSMHFCVQPPLPFLTLENTLPQPKHKVTLLHDLTGKIITAVTCQENDRQILISLNDDCAWLLFRLYGINGNVFLLDRHGSVLNSFKKLKKPLDFDLPGFQASRHFLPDPAKLSLLLKQHSDQSLTTFLTKSYRPVLPKILAAEICHRSNLPHRELLVNFNPEQIQSLDRILDQLALAIQNPTPRIYTGDQLVFSLIELKVLKESLFTTFDSLIDAQNEYIQIFLNQFRLQEKKKNLLNQIDLMLDSAQRKLIKQQQTLKNLPTSDNYREWADTLLAAAPNVPPFSNSLTLPQLTDASRQITIPLDPPKLNPIENAQRYYRKARQIETSRTELTQNIGETVQQIRQCENLRQKIAETTDFKSLGSLSAQLPRQSHPTNSIESRHQPFHRLVIDSWEILIGKSARDNDELLQKFARPHDFWLHAQGVSGSHVVVCNPTKTATLPRNTLEKIAGLAAFHSKARHSGVVPVIFAQCKYITKPRRSAPGAVKVSFEKTLIVEPLDPKKYF